MMRRTGARMEGYMNVRNCRGCGRLFNYVAGPPRCPICREKMEEKFQEVKEFIRENPGVSIPEVSEACDVESAQIRQWLREERLQLTEDSPIYLNCEACGANIRFGKYCEKCKFNMANDFNSILHPERHLPEPTHKKPEGSARGKMRYL